MQSFPQSPHCLGPHTCTQPAPCVPLGLSHLLKAVSDLLLIHILPLTFCTGVLPKTLPFSLRHLDQSFGLLSIVLPGVHKDSMHSKGQDPGFLTSGTTVGLPSCPSEQRLPLGKSWASASGRTSEQGISRTHEVLSPPYHCSNTNKESGQ